MTDNSEQDAGRAWREYNVIRDTANTPEHDFRDGYRAAEAALREKLAALEFQLATVTRERDALQEVETAYREKYKGVRFEADANIRIDKARAKLDALRAGKENEG